MKKSLTMALLVSALPLAARAGCVNIAGTLYDTECYNQTANSCGITTDAMATGDVYFNAPGTRFMYAKCLVETDLSKCATKKCSDSTYIGINVK